MLVVHLFNMEWTDYIIFAIWPSLLSPARDEPVRHRRGAISVLPNVILYAAYGYAFAGVWLWMRG